MVLTETWLKSQKDAEVGIDCFQVFCEDRKRKKKGCRCRLSGASVHDDLASCKEKYIDYLNGIVEILGLYSRTDNLFLAIVYRRPDDVIGGNRSTEVEFKPALDKLSKTLSEIGDPEPIMIICGDFNLLPVS